MRRLLCWLGWHAWWKPEFINVRECRRCPAREVMHAQAYPYRYRWEDAREAKP